VEGNPSKIAPQLKVAPKSSPKMKKLRHVEVLFAGDCEGAFPPPAMTIMFAGTRPERFAGPHQWKISAARILLNAIAISLNPARAVCCSIHKRLVGYRRAEVRALTIHSFTTSRSVCAGLALRGAHGFKIEQRTQEWFDLAIERICSRPSRQKMPAASFAPLPARKRPSVVLKAWKSTTFSRPSIPCWRKNIRLTTPSSADESARGSVHAGFRPRLAAPMLLAVLGRLKEREQANVLSKAGFRSPRRKLRSVLRKKRWSPEGARWAQMNAPIDAFRFLEKLPLDQIAYLMAESNKSAALSKIRAFLHKWRPMRIAFPL